MPEFESQQNLNDPIIWQSVMKRVLSCSWGWDRESSSISRLQCGRQLTPADHSCRTQVFNERSLSVTCVFSNHNENNVGGSIHEKNTETSTMLVCLPTKYEANHVGINEVTSETIVMNLINYRFR